METATFRNICVNRSAAKSPDSSVATLPQNDKHYKVPHEFFA